MADRPLSVQCTTSVESIDRFRPDHPVDAHRSEVPTLNTAALPFKPRARMLLLLGDQLIRNAGIAVFELVKNAYDADANHVKVDLLSVDDQDNGRIVVSDDGVGMNWEIVTQVWLEPGTDYRESQKKAGRQDAETQSHANG